MELLTWPNTLSISFPNADLHARPEQPGIWPAGLGEW